MSELGTVIFAGASGRKYDFDVYSIGADFKDIGAVYFFTERVEENQDDCSHTGIYIGQTDVMSARFDYHYAMPCIEKNGANCICIHAESNIIEREEIERDLIIAYKPICNRGIRPRLGHLDSTFL